MATVWLLQDGSDYYGPDFHAVFATEQAARDYIEAWGGEGGIMWELREVPLYSEPPEVFAVHTIVANRANTGSGPVSWPARARVYTRKYSTVDYDPNEMCPKVVSEPHLVRVDALSEDEAKRLFAQAMRDVTEGADRG